ncbi:hypothetical protein Acsp04_32490 [Actinomadura sp. NBRC 104425]|uniref:hypothetical protein n=1 Tax=Actinomadura sp. NBRC 104425 TaxID=3032204 RepID=UPI0024A4810B|nr:hypothetical protein [Actinomadura sp. NBRC 104425]GLZ13014.1 hypothetical protein Acsp04_32490 [Actinomadura sp. NBRC 104425]
MDVTIQLVRVSWTKASRGGPGAARRNACPEAFPLPSVDPPFVHTVHMREEHDFAPHETVTEGPPHRDLVHVREHDGLLHVELRPCPFGNPWRQGPRKNIRLAPGETLRWKINYRFSGNYGWSYRQDTLNIAYGHAFPPNIFLTPPTHATDERAHLF